MSKKPLLLLLLLLLLPKLYSHPTFCKMQAFYQECENLCYQLSETNSCSQKQTRMPLPS